jgi:hypothetical protein
MHPGWVAGYRKLFCPIPQLVDELGIEIVATYLVQFYKKLW